MLNTYTYHKYTSRRYYVDTKIHGTTCDSKTPLLTQPARPKGQTHFEVHRKECWDSENDLNVHK